MKSYDEKYLKLAKDILENGYLDNNRTGVETYKLPHQIMQFNLSKEFPILSTKFVAFKTAVKELLWIFKDQSNSVKELQEQNVKIWDEWEMEDGTIGTSYGWIVKKYNQIDKLIEALKNNPQDRRMMINLWQNAHLDGGALYPCCFCTLWDVTGDRLNCMLIQRSGDVPLGVPFNTTQYAVLVHLLAHVTGLKPGLFTHVINNAHIYTNQIEGINEQLERYELIKEIENGASYDSLNISKEEYDEYISVIESKPKLWINQEIKNFYDFTANDIKVEDYKHLKSIKMPVSV